MLSSGSNKLNMVCYVISTNSSVQVCRMARMMMTTTIPIPTKPKVPRQKHLLRHHQQKKQNQQHLQVRIKTRPRTETRQQQRQVQLKVGPEITKMRLPLHKLHRCCRFQFGALEAPSCFLLKTLGCYVSDSCIA